MLDHEPLGDRAEGSLGSGGASPALFVYRVRSARHARPHGIRARSSLTQPYIRIGAYRRPCRGAGERIAKAETESARVVRRDTEREARASQVGEFDPATRWPRLRPAECVCQSLPSL